MFTLFHHTLTQTSCKTPDALALQFKQAKFTYSELVEKTDIMAKQLLLQGLIANNRVAIYLPKQPETVISFYATSLAGGIFVPVNPLLKAPQVEYILQDCNVSILITSLSRYKQLSNPLNKTKLNLTQTLQHIILTDCSPEETPDNCLCWNQLIQESFQVTNIPSRISLDIAAILYTSGSTGKPKGVVLSHNNLIAGAKSVAEYLANHSQDRLLALLPFSFDYGLSQLTTAFISGASIVLMEYLLANDVVKAVAKYQITGLAAVPPLWIQLSELTWPDAAKQSLRYITNSGGAMPQTTLKQLIEKLPETKIFLMYGLTEAFRSTYLDPNEITNKPTSIGKAIPNAEILVINKQGEICQAGEEGELVHRGIHVALGYWNAPEKTAQRFKPLPQNLAQGLTPEIAVWSGDTVVKDEQGFLYFVGRTDDMIKSSGYRISPSEIEDCVYHYPDVNEVVAIGVPHPSLGEAIVLVIKTMQINSFKQQELLKYCQKELPNFMQPKAIALKDSLPRNPNGKINRVLLKKEFYHYFSLVEKEQSESKK